MDEQRQNEEVSARLNRIESDLRQMKGLLWAIGGMLLLIVVQSGPLLSRLLAMALYGIVAMGVVYAFYWLLMGISRRRARPRSDEELRAAILAKGPSATNTDKD